jgi:hypothetical protein
MGRPKSAHNVEIKPWASAKADNREGRFIQTGNSLLLDEKYKKLNPSAKHLYTCMRMECGGRRNFKFTHGTAKKYGIAESTFDRSWKELVEAGFIERVYDNEYCGFAPCQFRFNFQWKGIKEYKSSS